MANENNTFTEKQYLDYNGLIEVFKIIQGEYLSKDKVLELTNEEIDDAFCEVYECEEEEPFDPFNGHKYVDMGDAGIWATCNVGASKPQEYGLYFAWGETEGYPNASGNKKFSSSDYKFKYSNPTKYNDTDNLKILELEDDAAHINMGGNWRMPTTDEFAKLNELCNSEWTNNYYETGVKGRIFKLKTDESKRLFFPAAGNYSSGSNFYVGSRGYVWSSSLYSVNNGSNFSVTSGYVTPQNSYSRYYGLSVRGFMPKSE